MSFLESEVFKVCVKCLESKPLSRYTKASGGSYLRSECKDCKNKMARDVRALKKLHGEPPAGYTCETCGSDNPGRKNSGWCLDHCHISGKFKGWLCHDCNTAAGLCKNNPDIMDRLAKYTRRHADGSERQTEGE